MAQRPLEEDGRQPSAAVVAPHEHAFGAETLDRRDLLTLDNLLAHKGRAIRQAVKSAGARLLFLPPYSPDFNPTENDCPSKPPLRKAAARTIDGCRRAIDAITPTEIRTTSPQQVIT